MFSDIEAECQDDYMKIRIGFNGSFTGLLYSAGELDYVNRSVVKRIDLRVRLDELRRLHNLKSITTGYAYDPDCMYINGSGRDYYEFYIQLNRCGTLGKNSLHEDSRKNPTVSWCGENT